MRDLSLNGFRLAANEGNCPDIFVARFAAMLDRHGLIFPQKNNVTPMLAELISSDASRVSLSEMKSTGYVFNEKSRAVLIKLQQGERIFDKKETDELEALCGDFFDLWGNPRHANTHQEVCTTGPESRLLVNTL